MRGRRPFLLSTCIIVAVWIVVMVPTVGGTGITDIFSSGMLGAEIRSPCGPELHAEAERDTGNGWRVLLWCEERRP
jgi:hypothetical protein